MEKNNRKPRNKQTIRSITPAQHLNINITTVKILYLNRHICETTNIDIANRIKLMFKSAGYTSADLLKNFTKSSRTEHLAMRYSLPRVTRDFTLEGGYAHSTSYVKIPC